MCMQFNDNIKCFAEVYINDYSLVVILQIELHHLNIQVNLS